MSRTDDDNTATEHLGRRPHATAGEVQNARETLVRDLIDEMNRVRFENAPALRDTLPTEARARELAAMYVREAIVAAELGDQLPQRDELWAENERLRKGPAGEVQTMVHAFDVGDGRRVEVHALAGRVAEVEVLATEHLGRRLHADDLNRLAREVHTNARDKGFWDDVNAADPRHVASLLALIHSEVSEALEEVRSPDMEVDGHAVDGERNRAITEELADVIIRTLDMAAGLDLNIGVAVVEKMEKNAARPRMHGGKRL